MAKGIKPEPGQPYPELEAMILHLVLGAPRLEVRNGRSKFIKNGEYGDRELVLQHTREELHNRFSPRNQYVVIQFASDEYYAEKLQETAPDKSLPFALGSTWPSELGFSECKPYEISSRNGEARTGDYQFIDVVKRIRTPEGEIPKTEKHILVVDKNRFENAAIKVLKALANANEQGVKIAGFKKQADLIRMLDQPSSEISQLGKRMAGNLLAVEGVKAGAPILQGIAEVAREAGNYRFSESMQDAIAEAKTKQRNWSGRMDPKSRDQGGHHKR